MLGEPFWRNCQLKIGWRKTSWDIPSTKKELFGRISSARRNRISDNPNMRLKLKAVPTNRGRGRGNRGSTPRGGWVQSNRGGSQGNYQGSSGQAGQGRGNSNNNNNNRGFFPGRRGSNRGYPRGRGTQRGKNPNTNTFTNNTDKGNSSWLSSPINTVDHLLGNSRRPGCSRYHDVGFETRVQFPSSSVQIPSESKEVKFVHHPSNDTRFVRKRDSRESTPLSRTVLFPSVHSSEERRESEINYRPKNSQQLCRKKVLQNANDKVSHELDSTTLVGMQDSPARRILSYIRLPFNNRFHCFRGFFTI